MDAPTQAAERRPTVAYTITHLMRAGEVPAADDPAWADLDAALAAEAAALALLRQLLDASCASHAEVKS